MAQILSNIFDGNQSIMKVDNDVLYRGIVNQPSHAYSSLYLYDFLSFHILNNKKNHQRFL